MCTSPRAYGTDGSPAHSPGPHVDAGHFETVMPRTRVRALSLWAGAHPVPVCLAVLPAAAVRAAVVKVEPATVHQYLVGGGSAGGRGRRRRVAGQLFLRLQHLLLPVHVWRRHRRRRLLLLYGTAGARLQHRCSAPVGRHQNRNHCTVGRRRASVSPRVIAVSAPNRATTVPPVVWWPFTRAAVQSVILRSGKTGFRVSVNRRTSLVV